MKTNNNSMQWLRLFLGLVLVFALFHWTASVLGSDRGQYGVLIGLLVVAAIITAKIFLFNKSFKESVKEVGLTSPKSSGILIAILISVLMLLTILVFSYKESGSMGFK